MKKAGSTISLLVMAVFMLAAPAPALAGGARTSCATRYPVVLAHGMGATAKVLGIVDYWFGVEDALEDEGANVFATSVNAMDGTADKAVQFRAQVLEILAVTGKPKVNVIGHSHGGLYPRTAVSNLGLAPGDTLELPTADGSLVVTVAATFRDYASEHGRIFMDERLYEQLWPGQPLNTLALFARDGDVAAMRRAVSELASEHAIVITSAGAILRESMAVFDRTFRITEVLRILSLIVAFIGVLSALMALQLERGKEYAVLRALGLTRGQIAGLISGESLLMGLLAALVALPVGILMAWVLIESVQRRAFGWTMPFSVDIGLLTQTVLVGLLAAGLAALYPAWRSAHADPAPQLRED